MVRLSLPVRSMSHVILKGAQQFPYSRHLLDSKRVTNDIDGFVVVIVSPSVCLSVRLCLCSVQETQSYFYILFFRYYIHVVVFYLEKRCVLTFVGEMTAIIIIITITHISAEPGAYILTITTQSQITLQQ